MKWSPIRWNDPLRGCDILYSFLDSPWRGGPRVRGPGLQSHSTNNKGEQSLTIMRPQEQPRAAAAVPKGLPNYLFYKHWMSEARLKADLRLGKTGSPWP